MGNKDSYVGLDCVDCNKTYGRITWSDWQQAGTIIVYRGYCHSCCGESLPSVSWSGNVVKLGCLASGCNNYGVIGWDTWKISGTVWRKRGYCSGCYEEKKPNEDYENYQPLGYRSRLSGLSALNHDFSISPYAYLPDHISSLLSGFSAFTIDDVFNKTIRDVPSENQVYEFAQKYVSVAHSSVDYSVGFAETDCKYEENVYIPLEEDSKEDAIVSPSSIVMKFPNNGYTLNFGLRGSSVHVAVSRISFKGKDGYRTYFHFGVILAGNTYTITGEENFTGNYMIAHLLKGSICINVCKSRKMCFKALNAVWGGSKNEAWCVDRRLGHSVLSARIITECLMGELNIPYEYATLKKGYLTLDTDWPSYKLKTITNCYLFAQRFCKVLNIAHSANNDIKLPTASSIVLWSLGKQEWYEADKFLALWKHGKKNT